MLIIEYEHNRQNQTVNGLRIGRDNAFDIESQNDVCHGLDIGNSDNFLLIGVCECAEFVAQLFDLIRVGAIKFVLFSFAS